MPLSFQVMDNCEFNQPVTVTISVYTSGFSSNGDNSNESFDLSGFNVEKLKIFNRYGRTVFEGNNYVNQWVGQDYDGDELPSATYYFIKTKTGDSKTGWIYLQR